MNRQTTPGEVLDELIRWVSQQISQGQSPTRDHGAPSVQRGVWHNSRKGLTSDSAARCAPPEKRSFGMN